VANHFPTGTFTPQDTLGFARRENDEVQQRFFDHDGQLQADAIARLHRDIGTRLLPSPARALMLNKAYRTIVEDQSHTAGRDALPEPAGHVWKQVEQDAPTGIRTPLIPVALEGSDLFHKTSVRSLSREIQQDR
jgi:hypothetical protein